MIGRMKFLLLLSACALFAQQPADQSGVLSRVQSSTATSKNNSPNIPIKASFWDFVAPYRKVSAPSVRLGPADRARALVHNGVIQLSLYDAIALAIENNLDVEVARYQLSIAGIDVLRASGGGNLRGLDYSVAESPTGVGGPGSPLLNNAAASVTPTTPTVNDLTSLNILTETPSNLSEQNPAGYSAGPPVPLFQPTLVGQNTYFERSNSALLTQGTTSTTTNQLNFISSNYSLVQGFSYGTQVEVDVNNAAQVLYGARGNLDPYSQPNTSITLTQPMLKGFGREVNLRYLKIGAIKQKISRLLFYQQLISTVYGISRLYYDLVSLNENAAVKRQVLTAAEKLLADDQQQVEQGTLAPLELTRAQSLVTSSRLDLIQAEGLVHQQEVILKSQLSRQGSGDPVLAQLPIQPLDVIKVPATDATPALQALVSEAMNTRPDLAQATLQAESGEISASASRNAAKPEFDFIANFQTRGSTESPFTTLGTAGTGILTTPADLGVAGLRTSRIYQAGIQFNLPLVNRVAQADAARDLLQLRQVQARTQQLANQVREDVENSLIALRTARSALDAAVESRKYQEQLVDAERDKLTVGASTNFLVIQQESYLAQARSTEVAARSVYIKAQVALDRSVGDLLDKNGITFDSSVSGELPGAKPIQP